MKLTLSERYALMGILPTDGAYRTIKRVWELRETLEPDAAELEKHGAKVVGDQLRWDKTHATETVEIEIGETVMDLIKDKLKKLDDDSKLGLQHVTLFEKFVEATRPESKTDDEPPHAE